MGLGVSQACGFFWALPKQAVGWSVPLADELELLVGLWGRSSGLDWFGAFEKLFEMWEGFWSLTGLRTWGGL